MCYFENVIVFDEIKKGVVDILESWRVILKYKDFRLSRFKIYFVMCKFRIV